MDRLAKLKEMVEKQLNIYKRRYGWEDENGKFHYPSDPSDYFQLTTLEWVLRRIKKIEETE